MSRFFNLIFIIGIILLFGSCEDTTELEMLDDSEIISMEYGTSFGECNGYCINSISLNESKIEFRATGWDSGVDLPEMSFSKDISKQEWEELIQKINFYAFRNLEEVIGCPDCADGGAEWVKIITNNVSHKVTFEYENEPEQLEEMIDDLREYLEEFIEI